MKKSKQDEQKLKYKARPWVSDFYKAHDWQRWWEEFCTETVESGALKYPTIFAFARAKTKDKDERNLMLKMIGPKPIGKKLIKFPWLGDWEKRRANSWIVDDQDKYKTIDAALSERKDKLDAMHALTPTIGTTIKMYMKMAMDVNKAFAGQIFTPKYPIQHPVNKIRMSRFLRAQERIQKLLQNAWHEWFLAYGVDPAQMQQFVAHGMALAGQIGAAGALTGVAAAQVGAVTPSGQPIYLPAEITPTDIMLAQTVRDKARLFDMDTIVDGEVVPQAEESEVEAQTEDKSNGKAH